MEASEEELLENVTDESGNSYMIQRMTVDNAQQLLGTEIIQTPNGLVVDLGGDFTVNYSSDDLLTHDITEEDRNLAAALVAVQYSQQQKQQQTQQDGSVIINSALPSLLTTLDGSKVQLGEQQLLVQDKQTGFLQIVDADELYKQNFAKFSDTHQLQIIKAEEPVVEVDNQEPTKKKTLPHKKRIPRKLKKNDKGNVSKLQKVSYTQVFKDLDNQQHQTTPSVASNPFECQLCSTSFSEQLAFFEHLKQHYEPIKQDETKVQQAVQQQANHVEGEAEELENGANDLLQNHITILKAENEILHTHQGTIIKIEGTNEEQKETFLSSILQLNCLPCNRTFRKQKFYEAHMREAHGKEANEFSETEDLMAGINVNAHGEVTEIEGDNKAWYRDEELHATEEDLKELEAKEHVCQNCNQQFLDRGSLIEHMLNDHDHMITCTAYDEEDDEEVVPVKVKEDVVKKVVKRNNNKPKTELECGLCDRKFVHRNSLVYHLRSHSEDRPYQCDQCGKSFFAASALKVHLRLHSGEKPYRCEYCGRHFRQWGDLKYHCISIHSDEKQYQCEYCGKEFARKYSLIVHRRIHTGEKNYRCEFCGKTFRASSYLQNHRRIHTGEKPHACELCGKRFRVRSDMKRHLRTHSKTRRPGKAADVKTEAIEQIILPQESEDTNESMPLLKKESDGETDTPTQTLQYEADGGLETIRDANTLYVHMPILIT